MNIGIMQPYFFPYIGYFDLINRTDRWVVFDVVKYTPKSWMNRNRVLKADEGWQYITVPVHRHDGEGLIKDVRVVDKERALRRILGQIEHYRSARAPHYSATRQIIESAFSDSDESLVNLNVTALALVCRYLGVAFEAMVWSESGIALRAIARPGDWALEISTALKADAYTNPPGGHDLFDPTAFAERGIRLGFTQLANFRYSCQGYDFFDHLSIVDVLMWNSAESVSAYLRARAAVPVTPGD